MGSALDISVPKEDMEFQPNLEQIKEHEEANHSTPLLDNMARLLGVQSPSFPPLSCSINVSSKQTVAKSAAHLCLSPPYPTRANLRWKGVPQERERLPRECRDKLLIALFQMIPRILTDTEVEKGKVEEAEEAVEEVEEVCEDVLPDSKMENSALNALKNAQIKSMSKALHDSFATLRLLQKSNLLNERTLIEYHLKMGYREERFQRHIKFFPNDEVEKTFFLLEQRMMNNLLKHFRERINAAQRSFQDVENWMHQHEHEFTLLGEAAEQELKKKMKWEGLNVQLDDLQEQCDHVKYLFYQQDKEHELTSKLVHSLLAAHHDQCQTLKAAGLPVDADQEKLLGYLVQRDEDDETTLEMTEEVKCDTSLLPILEFSHLTLDQSTPC
ncbi:kinesin-like protein KIF18A, partial [Clarias magur]